MNDAFARRLLVWFDRYGRHDLPWQRESSRYRVWISEIMLQQTQVATVVGFFEAFTQRFPDIATLAAAPIDRVLHAWSGLGYYARARNLHRAAQLVRDEHGGELPGDLEALLALPGIGRSTAAAILALADGERHAILDGNVKRVLARYHAIDGWSGRADVAQRLWRFAERHTPRERVRDYTQAIMDLGAGLCTRTKPRCELCPVASGCRARRLGRQNELPTPRTKRARPLRRSTMLIALRPDGGVLLERRPPSGIWGGLWCFPSFANAAAARRWCRDQLGSARFQRIPVLRHGFTHFELDIEPLVAQLGRAGSAMRPARGRIAEPEQRLWYDERAPAEIGLATPVVALLARVRAPARGNRAARI